MSDYVLIGEPADSPHAVFELRIWDHLNKIDPTEFGVSDVPSLNPANYYVTSGDAISKTKQLVKDLKELLAKLKSKSPKGFAASDDDMKCVCGKLCTSKSGVTLHQKACVGYQNRQTNEAYHRYEEAVALCYEKAQILHVKLQDAKGPHCFLETEWVDHVLKLVPKDPRNKGKAD